MPAREAVQTAEDARLITLKNQADARLAAERAASASREAMANNAAAAAEAQANRTRLDATQAAQRATDEAKALAERVKTAADVASQQTARDKQAAEAATLQTIKNAADKSERETQELRSKLAGQLNTILQTRDSARGLVANMPDVLFDTGQYSLKPGAREVLAKLSGIVLAYPSLMLDVGGYTDSVGADEYNQTLSENRASAVRDFLISQGIVRTSIASQGFGEGQPIATNDTAAGRQQNRRVELVVSGEVIGTTTTTTIELKPLN